MPPPIKSTTDKVSTIGNEDVLSFGPRLTSMRGKVRASDGTKMFLPAVRSALASRVFVTSESATAVPPDMEEGVFCSSSSSAALVSVPGNGSKVDLPNTSPVVEPSDGVKIIFEASILTASPVRCKVALAMAIAARNSPIKSSADAVRCSGSFSRACRTAASICGGTSTPFEASGGTFSVRCFFMIDGTELPLNGTSPHSIW